jgi:DNA polymerase
VAPKKLKVDPATQGTLFADAVLRGPEGTEALVKLRADVKDCQKCPLHEHRRLVVFGAGRPGVRLALVGEAPGEMEDAVGHPFVGRSGHMLTRMLAAMGLQRDEVFLTNATLCRPAMNRTPTRAEIEACKPHLFGQLQAVHPEVIVCLGRTAAQALLPEVQAMEYMRLVWHEWNGIPVRVTFHPAFLIRPEGECFRWHAWLDMKIVLERLGLPIPSDAEARERSARIPDLGWDLK